MQAGVNPRVYSDDAEEMNFLRCLTNYLYRALMRREVEIERENGKISEWRKFGTADLVDVGKSQRECRVKNLLVLAPMALWGVCII